MRTRRALPALLIVLLFAIAACSSVTGTRSPTVAASVEDRDIEVAQVESQFEALSDIPQFAAELEAQEGFSEQVEAIVLSLYIQREIFASGGEELGVDVDEDDVDEQMAAQTGGIEDPDEMRTMLAEQGITPEFLRLQTELQVYQDRIGDALASQADDVGDDEIEAAYEQMYGGTPSARHILLDSEEDAEEILERLDDGEDFGELAVEESTDPSAQENEGELGPITEGQFDPDFTEAVQGAEEGEVVGPVATQFGYHVIERLEPPSLEEVEDEVREAAEADAGSFAVTSWINDRLEETEVVVNPRFGSWDAEQGTVEPGDALDRPSELDR